MGKSENYLIIFFLLYLFILLFFSETIAAIGLKVG